MQTQLMVHVKIHSIAATAVPAPTAKPASTTTPTTKNTLKKENSEVCPITGK
jgi:hypothetical protein